MQLGGEYLLDKGIAFGRELCVERWNVRDASRHTVFQLHLSVYLHRFLSNVYVVTTPTFNKQTELLKLLRVKGSDLLEDTSGGNPLL